MKWFKIILILLLVSPLSLIAAPGIDFDSVNWVYYEDLPSMGIDQQVLLYKKQTDNVVLGTIQKQVSIAPKTFTSKKVLKSKCKKLSKKYDAKLTQKKSACVIKVKTDTANALQYLVVDKKHDATRLYDITVISFTNVGFFKTNPEVKDRFEAEL